MADIYDSEDSKISEVNLSDPLIPIKVGKHVSDSDEELVIEDKNVIPPRAPTPPSDSDEPEDNKSKPIRRDAYKVNKCDNLYVTVTHDNVLKDDRIKTPKAKISSIPIAKEAKEPENLSKGNDKQCLPPESSTNVNLRIDSKNRKSRSNSNSHSADTKVNSDQNIEYVPYRKGSIREDSINELSKRKQFKTHPFTELMLRQIGKSRTNLSDLNDDDKKRLKRSFIVGSASGHFKGEPQWSKFIRNWLDGVDETSINQEILAERSKLLPRPILNNIEKMNHSRTNLIPPIYDEGRSSSDVINAAVERNTTKQVNLRQINDQLSSINEFNQEDANRDVRRIDVYTHICNQLEIRGPFRNMELNVLHSICCEYSSLARETRSKHLFKTFSAQHSDRVLAFLTSNQIGSHNNRKSKHNESTSYKTLVYIFSPILQQSLKRIEGIILRLDGFRLGRTLDSVRFSRIVSDAFNRRKYLFRCAVGEFESYSRIE